MSKTVVTYTRVSSEEQAGEDKVSIEQQQADIDNLITRNNWTMINLFSDTEKYIKTKSPKKGKRVQPSGEYNDRPGLLAMLDLVKTGSVDAIVCWREDRLMRHIRVFSLIVDTLDEADRIREGRPPVEIYDATGAKLDRFILGIKAQIGQEENKRRVERIKLGKVGTLKRGLWPGPYHRLGYATEQAERGKRILIGPESEVQTVRDIFNWYESGVGVFQIRRRLIAESRQQRGQSNGGKLRDWSQSAILHILRSEDYTGKATWVFNDGTPSISIVIPQIINPEQFRRVQKRIIQNRREGKRNTKGIFLLQNIAVCGGCGGKLSSVANSRYYYKHSADGTVKRYEHQSDSGYRYYCATAARYNDEPHTKPFCFYNGRELDNRFWAYIADRVVTHPELITEQVRNRQAELQEQGDNLDGEIAKKRKQLTMIEEDKMTYTRQLGRKKISEAVYDALITEAEEIEADLKEELNQLLILRDDQKKTQDAIDRVERLLADIRERLPEINQTPEELRALPKDKQKQIMLERQKIIRGLCSKVTVYADGEIVADGMIEVSNFDVVNSKNTGRGLP